MHSYENRPKPLSTAKRIDLLGDTYGDLEHILIASKPIRARGVDTLIVLVILVSSGPEPPASTNSTSDFWNQVKPCISLTVTTRISSVSTRTRSPTRE